MPFARFQDHSLFYTEYFHGAPRRPALVLVHGAGGTHLHWPPELRRLPHTTVYALDLPGHGKSAGPASASMADKAEAVEALLDHLGLARAVIAGHSMGGAIALSLALSRPERVAGLVLVATGAKLRVTPAILGQLPADVPGAVAAVMDMFFGPAAPEPLRQTVHQRMLQVDPDVMHGDFAACDQFDVRAQLPEITVPTLIIGGTQDLLTPVKYARYLAEHIPQADLKVISAGGHAVMLEQPTAVARAVEEFLARLPGVSG